MKESLVLKMASSPTIDKGELLAFLMGSLVTNLDLIMSVSMDRDVDDRGRDIIDDFMKVSTKTEDRKVILKSYEKASTELMKLGADWCKLVASKENLEEETDVPPPQLQLEVTLRQPTKTKKEEVPPHYDPMKIGKWTKEDLNNTAILINSDEAMHKWLTEQEK